MSETKTEVRFEVVTSTPDDGWSFTRGPYSKLSHVKMAMKQNAGLRCDIENGATVTVRKITRTFTEVEEVVDL